MRLAILILAALPALAQIKVQAQPASFAASAPALGPGKEAGAWKILACNTYGVAKIFDSTELLMALPSLPVLDEQEADALLNQRTRNSKWAKLGRGAMTAASIAGFVLAFRSGDASAITSIRVASGVQGGIAVLQLIGKDAESRAPVYRNTSPLEPIITLAARGTPGACIQRKVMASLVHGAKTMTATIDLP